jgi:hypothetical protein
LKKIQVGDATIRLVARVILALTVFALIGQAYIISIAAPIFLNVQFGSPFFYVGLAQLWFYGYSDPLTVTINPAWPGLIVAIACLAVLRPSPKGDAVEV